MTDLNRDKDVADIAVIIERVRAEGYARGWADCRDAMMKLTPQAPGNFTGQFVAKVEPFKTKRAPWGAVPKAIDRALEENSAIDVSIVRHAASLNGTPVADSSIRAWLGKLVDENKLEVANGEWRRKETAGQTVAGHPAASPQQ